jgi:hypothetical protein
MSCPWRCLDLFSRGAQWNPARIAELADELNVALAEQLPDSHSLHTDGQSEEPQVRKKL